MSDLLPRDPVSTSNTTSPASSVSTSALSTGRKTCRAPGCSIPHCNLRTHRRYDPTPHRHRCRQTRSNSISSTTTNNSALTSDSITIGRDGVDGMPALPVRCQNHHQSRSLFHHFFETVFDRLAYLFRGPVVAGMPGHKQRMLATALSSESYCSGLIVQSQTEIDIARNFVPESNEALMVYSDALQAFRKQVILVQHSPNPLQVELALLSLCTLLSYDSFHQRDTSSMMHWKGLQQLVALRGGLNNITVSLAYVVHVDRLCAQRLRMPPAFISESNQAGFLPRPLWSWYGSKFLTLNQARSSPISSRVINHCVDTCGMIGLWEVAKGDRAMSTSRTMQQQPPSLEYLYYIRDKIDEHFTILYAEMWNKRIRDKYILWTARILEYPYTWSNYVPTVNAVHCNHLITYLQGQDLRTWNDDTDLLTWILFALAVVPSEYSGRQWVMQELHKVLVSKLKGSEWPADWKAEELKNLRSFVWCDTIYTTRFRAVCAELERMCSRSAVDASESATNYDHSPMTERFKGNSTNLSV